MGRVGGVDVEQKRSEIFLGGDFAENGECSDELLGGEVVVVLEGHQLVDPLLGGLTGDGGTSGKRLSLGKRPMKA